MYSWPIAIVIVSIIAYRAFGDWLKAKKVPEPPIVLRDDLLQKRIDDLEELTDQMKTKINALTMGQAFRNG